MKDLTEINEKLNIIIDDIQSEGGSRERGIHHQVHLLEEKISDLDDKLDLIVKLIKGQSER